MKPILSNHLADAIGMLESFANLAVDQLVAKGFKRNELRVCWSAHHNSFVVAAQTPRWDSPKFVQTLAWVV